MPDAEGPERKPNALREARTRFHELRWPLGAAAFVLLVFVGAGRIGPGEGALAAALIALAVIVAPRPHVSKEDSAGGAALSTVVTPILSGLPDPVLVLDRRGAVAAFNEQALAVLGEIKVGEPVSFALRAPEVLAAVRGAGAVPRTVLYVERVPVERWREAHVARVKLTPEGPEAIVIGLRDLTEQRRSERMRGDFVANASHELRTPLASLLGFIETLQGPARNDPGARDRFLEIMRAQANRMSRLIDDLLSLSRIELKAHVRPRAVVDLTAVVSGVVDALGPLAHERAVEIKVGAGEPPVLVRGDRDELIRVAENLIENAIKYGQSGGRVDVTVSGGTGEEAARLVVRDYGPGVAPEHLPRLTERFYRVDVSDSRDKGGTGLGLALVKHVVQRHGGRLSIDSAAGEGATFTVVLDGAEADGEPLRRVG
ncbi:ATP-binding protein [Hansschlegelia zhihuaiae]|uniref:histidine kinase n=1 Tax=Hansschlegelia zhihuaiae TaxID=405005 RepID=A0A4V1KJ30_9HYPH|nr:ATP-binding protein [Hansschlegelia zhihuaiae]RXF72762.1 histidine kinase [Hansschlegelia zhihuaiae]